MCIFFLTPSICKKYSGTHCGRFICKHDLTVDSCQNGPDCTSIDFRVDPGFVGVLDTGGISRMASEVCLDCDRDRAGMFAQCKIQSQQREIRRLGNLLSKADDIIRQTQTDSMVLDGFDTPGPRLQVLPEWNEAIENLVDSRNAEETR